MYFQVLFLLCLKKNIIKENICQISKESKRIQVKVDFKIFKVKSHQQSELQTHKYGFKVF